METIEMVKGILGENLDIEPEGITPDSSFESLGVDSLDMVELVCEIESQFDIEFGEPEGLETVGELCAYIEDLR